MQRSPSAAVKIGYPGGRPAACLKGRLLSNFPCNGNPAAPSPLPNERGPGQLTTIPFHRNSTSRNNRSLLGVYNVVTSRSSVRSEAEGLLRETPGFCCSRFL
jgi:hypothetical protein